MAKAKNTHIGRDSRSGRFVMTRSDIGKLNAVEGVRQSTSSRGIFVELDRKGASPEERRRAVTAWYASKKG